MAKSLRSKSKLKAKTLKRKGEFEEINRARQERIAKKLAEGMAKQKEDNMEEESSTTTESGKKVSTSGWRTLRKQEYIVKKCKGKKKSSIKFWIADSVVEVAFFKMDTSIQFISVYLIMIAGILR